MRSNAKQEINYLMQLLQRIEANGWVTGKASEL